MTLSAARAVSAYMHQEGDHFHDVNLNDPSFSRIHAYVPWTEILGKLSSLRADARDNFQGIGTEMSEAYRAPFLSSMPFSSLKDRFRREVLSAITGPLKILEEEGLNQIGPPMDTTWNEYAKGRFMPHYKPYSGRADVSRVQYYIHEFCDRLVAANGNKRFPVLDVGTVLAGRRVESDMGFYHMRTLKSLDSFERMVLIDDVTRVIQWWDDNPEVKRFVIVPGTRISHAPIGSEPEDYNRVIMSMDLYSFCSIGRWSYPMLQGMRHLLETSGIFGYRHVADFVRDNPDYGYISADSSRMDASGKYHPFGKIYAEGCISATEMPADIVRTDVYAAHHPMVVSPSGVFFGPIGVASGKNDTTAENTIYSYSLGSSFCDAEGIRPEDRVVFCAGDDLLIAYKRRKYHVVEGNAKISRHWSEYGFKAKPEKQLFSEDTALFLKRRFSRDPLVGESTMLLTNVLKKLVYMLPSAFGSMYTSRFNDDFDYRIMLRYLRVLSAEAKYYSRKKRLDEEPNRVGPIPPTALWPYNVPRKEALVMFRDWEGARGPVTLDDLEDSRIILERFSVIPDTRTAYQLGAMQALGQCVTHPAFPLFCRFLATYANLPHSVDWVGFIATMGESYLPSYQQEGGVGPILYAVSMFLKMRYGSVSEILTDRVQVWLETAPQALRDSFEAAVERVVWGRPTEFPLSDQRRLIQINAQLDAMFEEEDADESPP